MRFNLKVQRGEQTTRLRTDYPLRLYRSEHLLETLSAEPSLELCDVFDFWYDIEDPLQLNDEISDTVLVLRKR